MVVGYRAGTACSACPTVVGGPGVLRAYERGLDVHARSVAAAAIDGVTGELFESKLSPSFDGVRAWLSGLPGPVAVTYEAGPTGFGLYRSLTGAGFRCEVARPVEADPTSGDRVKTDAKDAVLLARLLRMGEIVPVAVPTVEQEAARDLVRAREDVHGDLMRARHRLFKLLLRHGIVYSGGQAWTGTHDAWLRREARRQLLNPVTQPRVRCRLRHGVGHRGPPRPARREDRDTGR